MFVCYIFTCTCNPMYLFDDGFPDTGTVAVALKIGIPTWYAMSRTMASSLFHTMMCNPYYGNII